MDFQNDIQLFDKYTQSELNESEQRDFEENLQSDFNLKSDFEEHQLTVAAVRQFERARLKEMLQNSAPPQRNNIRRITPRIFRIGIAASILLIVGFGMYFLSQSDARLYASYDLDESPNTVMGERETAENRTNYDAALTLKEAGKLTEAIAAFDKVSEENISLYFIAQYNKAMLQFKTGDKTTAQQTLNKIIQHPENHFIKDKAKDTLDAMEKTWFF